MATEQQSLDALLPFAKEHEPGLAEALTQLVPPRLLSRPLGLVCSGCGARSFRGMDYITHGPGCGDRVPLPLDSAHVAAERWMGENGWILRLVGDVYMVTPPGLAYAYDPQENASLGADIFAAIKAALEEE